MASTKRSQQLGLGCMSLIAVPCIVAGVVGAYWTLHAVLEHAAMKLWVETPAVVTQTALKSTRKKNSTSYQATATYVYDFGGRRFTGERVGLHTGGDNLGTFHRDAYAELERHRVQKRPFRAFVNPANPAQAVLFRELRWEVLAMSTMLAAVFGCVGLGMLTAAIVQARRMPPAAPRDHTEDQPWRARSDWASGHIDPAGGTAVAVPVLGVLALSWLVASGPLIVKLPVFLSQAASPYVWLTLIFPAVGLLLIGLFAHQFLRSLKFGRSTLQLATIPGVVGGKLAGVVQIEKAVVSAEGFRLVLSCVERVKRDKSTHDEVRWQDEKLILEPMRDAATGSIAIPVLFAIPLNVRETSPPESDERIKWRLEVTARLPGVNYRTCFEVPVFKTPESRADFQLDESLAADFVKAPPREVLLRAAGVVEEPLPGGGVRLVFPAARNLGSAIGVTLFLAFWIGATWFWWRVGAPIVFPIVLGLLALFFIWIAVDLWLYRSVVEARSDGLTFRGGLLGIGKLRRWSADEVKRFGLKNAMSSGTHVWKNIDVLLGGGVRRTIAQNVYGKLAQQAVIEELNGALRREGEEAAIEEIESSAAKWRRERLRER